MSIKKHLGSGRRGLYGLHDNRLYRRWLKNEAETKTAPRAEWRPLISIVVPTYNTDLAFFNVMVESVLGQSYGNWELILIDDKSPNESIRERIKYYANLDRRIKYHFLATNHHIAGATNVGIKKAKGIFVGLLDHDDVLQNDALTEAVVALNRNRELEFIYTDEDKIIGSARMQPFFKPDLNIDLLHSVNYITHFSLIRKTTLERVGYEREAYNGAQDWELFLRVVRNVSPQHICHIPKVLYSWRVHDLSTSKDMGVKPYVLKAQEQAIRDDLDAREVSGYSLSLDPKYAGQWRISYGHRQKESVLQVKNLHISKDQLESYNFVAIVKGRVTRRKQEIAQRLLGEASRADIGLVVSFSRSAINKNIERLLGVERTSLIRRFTHIAISKHIYETARYNVPEVVDYDIAIIATAKLKALNVKLRDVNKLSLDLDKAGYRHVCIPYAI